MNEIVKLYFQWPNGTDDNVIVGGENVGEVKDLIEAHLTNGFTPTPPKPKTVMVELPYEYVVRKSSCDEYPLGPACKAALDKLEQL